jgi:hypothetical protein
VVGGARIFLSLRRGDSSAHAVRLREGLIGPFGGGGVMMGMDDLPLIRDAVARSDVLLVLIGQRWLTARDAAGRRCIDDLDDPVRLQIETALRNRLVVVPVLVQGARMPSHQELPEPIASLASRTPFQLSDGRWHADVRTLVDGLEQVLGSAGPAVAEVGGRRGRRRTRGGVWAARSRRRRAARVAFALASGVAVVTLVIVAVVQLWPA